MNTRLESRRVDKNSSQYKYIEFTKASLELTKITVFYVFCIQNKKNCIQSSVSLKKKQLTTQKYPNVRSMNIFVESRQDQ